MGFHRWPFLFLPHNAGVLSAARILTNTHCLLSQTGLGLLLAHRTLLLPKTQRTCHQRRVQRDRRGSEGSFFRTCRVSLAAAVSISQTLLESHKKRLRGRPTPEKRELDFASRSGGKFVVSWVAEACDAQARGLNPKFRLRILGGNLWPYLTVEVS